MFVDLFLKLFLFRHQNQIKEVSKLQKYVESQLGCRGGERGI